jgi:hypothetical protein
MAHKQSSSKPEKDKATDHGPRTCLCGLCPPKQEEEHSPEQTESKTVVACEICQRRMCPKFILPNQTCCSACVSQSIAQNKLLRNSVGDWLSPRSQSVLRTCTVCGDFLGPLQFCVPCVQRRMCSMSST